MQGMLHEIDEASMGPRLFSRGNVVSGNFGSLQIESFNGATAIQPWKHE